MTDADPIIDVITYGLAIMFIFVILGLMSGHMTENAVEGRIETNYQFMKSQDTASAFMRHRGSGTNYQPINKLLMVYHSLEGDQEIKIDGDTYNRENIHTIVDNAVKSYTTPNTPNAKWVNPEGIDIGEYETGFVMPVPTSDGGVKRVWVWN